MNSPEESTLREEILDIIYNQFSFPNSVVNKSSRSARKFDHEKQADKLLKLILERERLARINELEGLGRALFVESAIKNRLDNLSKQAVKVKEEIWKK